MTQLLRFVWMAAAFGVATVAGCAGLPHDPEQQHAVDAGTLGLSPEVAPRIDNGWWHAYQDEQLDGLVQRALAGNPTLAQALSRVREAQAASDATHAGLRPNLTYDAQDQWQHISANYILPPPLGGGTDWLGQERLNMSWDLDFWGRQASLLKRDKLLTAADQLDVATARLALAGALARTYIELHREYAFADVAARTEQQRARILEITRRRVQEGLDTNVELNEAENAVAAARVQLRQAESAQSLAIHQIAALCGEGANGHGGLHRPTLNLEAALPLPNNLPSDLLGHRPDVLAARARVEAARAGQAAAKAAFYPDLSLAAFIGTDATSIDNLFAAPSRTYGIGPALHLPLFEGGRLHANYRGATAQIDDAIANYNATVFQAVSQAADQLSLVEALRKEVADQQAALEAAERAYHLAEERYEAGLSGYLTVLSAETQLLNARRQRVELGSDDAIARVSLLLAVGGSFDPEKPATDWVAAK